MLGDANIIPTIAVKDLKVAKEFYEGKLGLKAVKDERSGQGVIYKSGNSQVLVYTSSFAGTNKATSAAWEIKDIEAVVNELKGKGITFEQYDNIPGVKREGDIHILEDLKAAWFKDPDGNILNVTTGM